MNTFLDKHRERIRRVNGVGSERSIRAKRTDTKDVSVWQSGFDEPSSHCLHCGNCCLLTLLFPFYPLQLSWKWLAAKGPGKTSVMSLKQRWIRVCWWKLAWRTFAAVWPGSCPQVYEVVPCQSDCNQYVWVAEPWSVWKVSNVDLKENCGEGVQTRKVRYLQEPHLCSLHLFCWGVRTLVCLHENQGQLCSPAVSSTFLRLPTFSSSLEVRWIILSLPPFT